MFDKRKFPRQSVVHVHPFFDGQIGRQTGRRSLEANASRKEQTDRRHVERHYLMLILLGGVSSQFSIGGLGLGSRVDQ